MPKLLVVVNSYKVSPAEAIPWCQQHTPFRWARHSVPSEAYEGMWEYSKTAYAFSSREDAILFKLKFGGTVKDIDDVPINPRLLLVGY